jgi:hypothetical protein
MLRQALEPERQPRAEPRVLQPPGGFFIEATPDQLDVLEFEARMESASPSLQRDEVKSAGRCCAGAEPVARCAAGEADLRWRAAGDA